MQATEMLKEEHLVIERICQVLNAASDQLEKSKDESVEIFEKSIDFIRNFADRCHHGKEEDSLFPALQYLGIPKEGGPIGVMLIDHEDGRKFVAGMVEGVKQYKSGNKAAREAIVRNARGYAALLPQHIEKENNILYPMGDSFLRKADNERLLEKFEQIEKERLGEGKHHQYIELVQELEKKVKEG